MTLKCPVIRLTTRATRFVNTKSKTMKKKNSKKANKNLITAEMVREWLGSDQNSNEPYLIIAEVANGLYKPEDIKEDIIGTLDLDD